MLLLTIGFCIGSFLGALTYRYPRRASVLTGRSKCDSCGKQIRWFDNIPLLSYMLLLGRCRDCKKKISVRNPLIETVTALAFLLLGLNCFYLIIFCILFSIFIIDLEHKIIPDDFTFSGILVTFIFLTFTNGQIVLSSLFGGLIGATFLLLIYLGTKGRGMGLGDVKFAVLGGLLVGINFIFIWLLVAFLTGAVVGIILILGKVSKLKDEIAFGPFLVLAIPVTLTWGQKILDVIR